VSSLTCFAVFPKLLVKVFALLAFCKHGHRQRVMLTCNPPDMHAITAFCAGKKFDAFGRYLCLSPRSSPGLFHISTTSELAVGFRCLSSLPISLIRQLSRSQPSRLHPLTSITAHTSTGTDSHRAVELTVLIATARGRGTVSETGLQMVTASGITADLICQIMTVSLSVSTDTGTDTQAKMTGEIRTVRGGIEIEMMLR